jgi:WD40 repeat protein
VGSKLGSYEVATGKAIASYPLKPPDSVITKLAVNGDGSRAAIAVDGAGVQMWNLPAGEIIKTLPADGVIRGLSFSRDSNRLAGLAEQGNLQIWNATDGRLLVKRDIAAVCCLAYSPTEDVIAVGQYGAVQIVDADAKDVRRLAIDGLNSDNNLLRPTINDIAFSPDGQLVGAVSADGSATIWRTDTGAKVRSFEPPANTRSSSFNMHSLTWSRDGHRLFTAQSNSQVGVWDVNTGQQLFAIPVAGGNLWEVAMSSTTQRMAVTAGFISTLALDIEELLGLAKARVTRSLTAEECHRYMHTGKC